MHSEAYIVPAVRCAHHALRQYTCMHHGMHPNNNKTEQVVLATARQCSSPHTQSDHPTARCCAKKVPVHHAALPAVMPAAPHSHCHTTPVRRATGALPSHRATMPSHDQQHVPHHSSLHKHQTGLTNRPDRTWLPVDLHYSCHPCNGVSADLCSCQHPGAMQVLPGRRTLTPSWCSSCRH